MASLAFANPIDDAVETFKSISTLDLSCLSKAIHHEAKGESALGKRAVGHVVLNRVNDNRFPASICDVVKQRTAKLCEFSWVCSPGKWNQLPSKEAEQIAYELLTEKKKDPTNGALFFHYAGLDLHFNRKQTTTIGNHIFYK